MPTIIPTTNPFGPNTNPTSWTGPYTGLVGATSGTGTLPPPVQGYTGFDPLLIFAIVIGCVAVVLTFLIVTCLVCWCNKRQDTAERKERILLESRQLKTARYKQRIIDDSPAIQQKVKPPDVTPAYTGPPNIPFHVIPDNEPTQTILTNTLPAAPPPQPPPAPMQFTVTTPQVSKETAGIVQCAQCGGVYPSSANLVQCASCGGGGVQRSTVNLLQCEQCDVHKSSANLVNCDSCAMHKSQATLLGCSPVYGGMSSSYGGLATSGSCMTGCDVDRRSHVERVGCARSSDAKQLHNVNDCGCNGRSVLKSGNTTFIHNHQY